VHLLRLKAFQYRRENARNLGQAQYLSATTALKMCMCPACLQIGISGFTIHIYNPMQKPHFFQTFQCPVNGSPVCPAIQCPGNLSLCKAPAFMLPKNNHQFFPNTGHLLIANYLKFHLS
jgi:hypothetical protein